MVGVGEAAAAVGGNGNHDAGVHSACGISHTFACV